MPKAITVRMRGDFSKTDRFFARLRRKTPYQLLQKYGEKGVAALMSATPVDSGLTASSWYYEIKDSENGMALQFRNSNIQNGWVPVAILLQYGHASRNGSWVEGRDYINPAIQPLFDQMAKDAWKEVIGS